MTVLKRFQTDEHGLVELGWNGTSIDIVYSDEDDNLVNLMVRPERLVDILEESNVSKDTLLNPEAL